MKLSNDTVPALEADIGDIKIKATNSPFVEDQVIFISQPCAEYEDIIYFKVDRLDQIIKELQEIRAAYALKESDPNKSEDYHRGWDDSITHHLGPSPVGGYNGPYGLPGLDIPTPSGQKLSDYEQGWNDAWEFLYNE